MKNQTRSSKSLVISLITIGLMCAFWVVNPAMAEDKKLTGSWIATVTPQGQGAPPPFLVLPTFLKGGSVIVSGQGDSAARLLLPNTPAVLQSAAHGSWKRTGPRTFRVTFLNILYLEDGSLAGTLKVTSIFKVSQSGKEFDSETSIGEVIDSNGNVMFSLEAGIHGERIRVE